MSLTEEHVPSPADTPDFTAAELLTEIEQLGGRVFRMKQPPRVFVLTADEQLAQWLQLLGGKPYLPVDLKHLSKNPKDAYRRTRDTWEWDIVITNVPVRGEETMWEAAGAFERGRRSK